MTFSYRCSSPSSLVDILHYQNIPTYPTADIARHIDGSCQLMMDLEEYSHALNEVFQGLDPAQHAAHVELRNKTEENVGYLRAFDAVDPCLMQGRTLIANRITERHIDRHDPPHGWAAISAIGPFRGGGYMYFPRLNARIRFSSGDLFFIRGGILEHEVEAWVDGQRFSIAHSTPQSLWDRFGVHLPL
jgi:hypothetical protein